MVTKQSFTNYRRNPYRVTEGGVKVLQCRLSLRETQSEFAKRFKVSRMTLHRWENGQTITFHPIYRDILDLLWNRLKRDNMLLPEPVVTTVVRETKERLTNAK
jgi:transcriptional regulator with XRE-family HTH domain